MTNVLNLFQTREVISLIFKMSNIQPTISYAEFQAYHAFLRQEGAIKGGPTLPPPTTPSRPGQLASTPTITHSRFTFGSGSGIQNNNDGRGSRRTFVAGVTSYSSGQLGASGRAGNSSTRAPGERNWEGTPYTRAPRITGRIRGLGVKTFQLPRTINADEDREGSKPDEQREPHDKCIRCYSSEHTHTKDKKCIHKNNTIQCTYDLCPNKKGGHNLYTCKTLMVRCRHSLCEAPRGHTKEAHIVNSMAQIIGCVNRYKSWLSEKEIEKMLVYDTMTTPQAPHESFSSATSDGASGGLDMEEGLGESAIAAASNLKVRAPGTSDQPDNNSLKVNVTTDRVTKDLQDANLDKVNKQERLESDSLFE